ncbi:MAG: hypothetical protein JJT96_10845 [Opitutales bacterium]|nr:hypothetical protein [Opitutales bacterium]
MHARIQSSPTRSPILTVYVTALPKPKSWVFSISWFYAAALFGLFLFLSDANPLFGFWFPWEVVLVILFHEAGHFAVAKAFRWNTSPPLLLPYVGGVVFVEELSHGPRWKVATLLLAGPIPGMLIGAACLTLPGIAVHLDGRLYSAAYALFFLNALNLLPIFPLDGGRLLCLFLKEEGTFRLWFETVGLWFIGITTILFLLLLLLLGLGLMLLYRG